MGQANSFLFAGNLSSFVMRAYILEQLRKDSKNIYFKLKINNLNRDSKHVQSEF